MDGPLQLCASSDKAHLWRVSARFRAVKATLIRRCPSGGTGVGCSPRARFSGGPGDDKTTARILLLPTPPAENPDARRGGQAWKGKGRRDHCFTGPSTAGRREGRCGSAGGRQKDGPGLPFPEAFLSSRGRQGRRRAQKRSSFLLHHPFSPRVRFTTALMPFPPFSRVPAGSPLTLVWKKACLLLIPPVAVPSEWCACGMKAELSPPCRWCTQKRTLLLLGCAGKRAFGMATGLE